MLAIMAGAGLALCAGFLALAWWLGGDDLFHDPRAMQGLKPLIDMATRKEWRWSGGDTLALDTPMTIRYEPKGMAEGGKPVIAVTGPADSVRHVHFSNGRIGADTAVPVPVRDTLKAVVSGVPIRKFVVNGGQTLELGHVDQDELSVYVNGGGTVSGDGRVGNLNLTLNGPGEANLGDLSVEDAKINILGPGDVTLSPHGDVKLFMAGNGHVVLKTRPASIKRTILGNAVIETPDGVEVSPPPVRPRGATPATPPTPAPTPMPMPMPAPMPTPMIAPVPPTPMRDATPATPVPPEEINATGGRNRDLGHFDQNRLTINVSGSGSVRAEGRVEELTVNIQHSGNANLGDLAARKVTVHLMGSGNAKVSPSDEADISIMGSGNVTLMSKPPVIRRAIMGAGRIIGAR
jgi:hypothetical protein